MTNQMIFLVSAAIFLASTLIMTAKGGKTFYFFYILSSLFLAFEGQNLLYTTDHVIASFAFYFLPMMAMFRVYQEVKIAKTRMKNKRSAT